jgi:glycerophosphoryl diester phosphodiesterase
MVSLKKSYKLIGHRGCRGEEPENTLLGMRSALAKGVDGIEMDVHLTRDGKLAVIHDDTVDRTTNGQGAVSGFTYQALRRLDAGKGEKVPLLEEVLELTKDVELFVEIKCDGAERAVVRAIEQAGRVHNASVKAFNHRIVRRVKELNRRIRTACLMVGTPVCGHQVLAAARADILSVSAHYIDKKLVDDCHGHGKQVFAWTVNDQDLFDRLARMKVDYIATDYPAKIPGKK